MTSTTRLFALGVATLWSVALTGIAQAQTISGTVSVSGKLTVNAVVSIDEVPGDFPAPTKPVTMDQKGKEFVPKVIAILKGSTVTFLNSDPFFHNVFSSSRVQPFNVSQAGKGDSSNVTFDKPGILTVRCHVHANMRAYIVVLSNPFFAVTDEKGAFKISGLKPGSYVIRAWSPTTGSSTQKVDVLATGDTKATFNLVP